MLTALTLVLVLSATPPPATLQCSKDTPEFNFPTWKETEDEVKATWWAGNYPVITHNTGRYLWSDHACVLGRAAVVRFGFGPLGLLDKLWISYGINGPAPEPTQADVRTVRKALEKQLGTPRRSVEGSVTHWSWETREVQATLSLSHPSGEPSYLQLTLHSTAL